jgi:hypothetical protein
MIKESQMLPMLVEVCPTFAEKWQEHKEEYKDEENHLHYIALADFARHLFELERQNQTENFAEIFELIERFNFEGSESVQNAVVVGLLESLQNIAGNNNFDDQVFLKYLRPESLKWWNQVHKFWDGEIQYIGQTYNEES